jgi:hypothetical protein
MDLAAVGEEVMEELLKQNAGSKEHGKATQQTPWHRLDTVPK